VEPAVTAAGETSAAVTVAAADTTPPSPPSGLVAVPSAGAVRLAWNPSPEPDVAAYAVYRAGESGELMRIGTTMPVGTVYTDRDVRPGTTYRYAVTALDNARRPNESARSNVVSALVP
jgi:fibronectin type 3 domain-containing protein